MNEIKFDKRNYRKHDKKNKSLIKKSLEKFGAGRSIVVDAEGEIIGGNGVYEQAQKLGLKTKIVETDGSELVVVKRTDLKTDDEKRKALAVMDNSTSDTSEFDLELLTADFSVDELKDFGIELPEEKEEEDEDNKYSIKINPPVYTKKKEKKPKLSECVDLEKYNELKKEIESNKNISEEERELLLLASTRHICFNYENIAEYYCHCSDEVKLLMKKNALVIVDINKAIEFGFVKYTEEIINIIEENEKI